MQKAVVAALLLVALGLALGFTIAYDSGGKEARVASLRLVKKSPLTVRGEHFRPGERVRLRTTLRRKTAATAGPQGSFLASFQAPTTRCDRVRVIAVGSEGSHAVLKLLPSPACIAARTPGSST